MKIVMLDIFVYMELILQLHTKDLAPMHALKVSIAVQEYPSQLYAHLVSLQLFLEQFKKKSAITVKKDTTANMAQLKR